MLTPPSLVSDYSLVYSGDPALDAPDLSLLSPDTDEYRKAKEDWQLRLEIARDTGVWDGLIKPGQRPTVFRMRQIPGAIRRRLLDLGSGEMSQKMAEFSSLCFRSALVLIENFGEDVVKIPKANDALLDAQIATVAITNRLDEINIGIVGELGQLVLMRAMRIGPK